MIQNKEVLEQIREEAVKELNSYDCRILVCSGTGCVATGSQKIYEKFMEIAKDAPGVTIEFGPHDKDAHVGVKKTGCQGVCELGPLVRIQKGDDVIQYTKVQIEAVRLFFIQCILLAGENINPCKNDSSCNHKLRQMICESANNISQISG